MSRGRKRGKPTPGTKDFVAQVARDSSSLQPSKASRRHSNKQNDKKDLQGGNNNTDKRKLTPGSKEFVAQVAQNSSSLQPSNASRRHPKTQDDERAYREGQKSFPPF
ncbi:hypothetical protein TNCT_81381 [Trichonephila clavata]|uniref:Uncharacterized protein n=1 Tax=Trichonephila clavata TaxID=2740835 RepID=A0A8X6M4L4_TRICU|nr:hypothetical protein TNCT_81381 [Trichonephila clavata]